MLSRSLNTASNGSRTLETACNGFHSLGSRSSRFGLYGFDVGLLQLEQLHVDEKHRGEVWLPDRCWGRGSWGGAAGAGQCAAGAGLQVWWR